MTDEEILYKAIMKAEKNGYREHLTMYLPLHLSPKFNRNKIKKLLMRVWHTHMNDIIFSHEFAGAFWPRMHETCLLSSRMGVKCDHEMCNTAEYKLQLQYMVCERDVDRIKYLGRFL